MASRRTVVVLTYHGIIPKPTQPPAKYRRIRHDFRMDMELINRLGYDVISFDDLAAAVDGSAPLHNDAVIITFDDGLMSQHDFAIPVLTEVGYKATFFVCPGLMATREYFFSQATVEDILGRVLPNGDWQFDVESHGFNHVDLKDLSPEDRDAELWAAHSSWEEMFSMRRVHPYERDMVFAERRNPVLALPYGGVNTPEMQAAARVSGYRMVRTAVGGAIHLSDRDPKPNLLNIPSYLLHQNSDLEALLSRRSQWPASMPYARPK